jgi:hypothetical protein
MKPIWPCLYFALFLASFSGGMGLFGVSHAHTNVDWIFVGVSFFGCLIFPFFALRYARSRTSKMLPRASFLRGFSGGWWADPLQCLRVTMLLLCGQVLGLLFITLPHASAQGIMVLSWWAAMLLGFVIGDLAARKQFRGSIA